MPVKISVWAQSVEALAAQELLGDLALELDAVGAVSGHELSSKDSIPCQSSHLKLSTHRGALHILRDSIRSNGAHM